MEDSLLKNFFLPKLTPKYFIRVAFVAILAYLIFGHVCIPAKINGSSMEPIYHDGGINFCWTPSYWFKSPKRGDVVMVRLAGKKIMFLKRIVAVGDETVEFRDGKILINGKEINEPYVRFPCDWNLPPRKVETGNVYVVGDNRDMNIDNHFFGQTSAKRIAGKPLW
ncbi:MAG: signal peptidase I [Lentisphaerae bacterium]|nr:signal peptidase I [Lentisphaerota bacterium]